MGHFQSFLLRVKMHEKKDLLLCDKSFLSFLTRVHADLGISLFLRAVWSFLKVPRNYNKITFIRLHVNVTILMTQFELCLVQTCTKHLPVQYSSKKIE